MLLAYNILEVDRINSENHFKASYRLSKPRQSHPPFLDACIHTSLLSFILNEALLKHSTTFCLVFFMRKLKTRRMTQFIVLRFKTNRNIRHVITLMYAALDLYCVFHTLASLYKDIYYASLFTSDI